MEFEDSRRACCPEGEEAEVRATGEATERKGLEGELAGLKKGLEEARAQLEEKERGIVALRAEMRELREQTLQQEKMASIGQLAAGVAHEINNPSGFVSSNLRALDDYRKAIFRIINEYRVCLSLAARDIVAAGIDGELAVRIERIKALETELEIDFIMEDVPNLIADCIEGTDRIKKIVKDLKDFAYPCKHELTYADINRNLDTTINIVWNEIKYNAVVTRDYGQLPEVRCYSQQINQVFLNLLINAAQAIQTGQGEIGVGTRSLDNAVQITISDNGSGIASENISKIFDPFFTTKPAGKGTGLGLNVAFNIIRKHNGSITVESETGRGTTFTITLPVNHEDGDDNTRGMS